MSLRKTDPGPPTVSFAADQRAAQEHMSTVLLRTYRLAATDERAGVTHAGAAEAFTLSADYGGAEQVSQDTRTPSRPPARGAVTRHVAERNR